MNSTAHPTDLSQGALLPTCTSGSRLHWLSHHAYAVTAGFIIAEGMILRLHHFGRDLSIAEAWVANSVLADTLFEMFHYDSWLQTTPPLFLILVRATVNLFGLSNSSLCAISLVFSLLALVILATLAHRMLRPAFALICLSVLALSPPVIAFSKQLKHYSADIAASTLLLLVLWEYLRNANRRHYFLLVVAFAVTLPLSYTAVIFVPLAICVLFLSGSAEGRLSRAKTLALRYTGLVFLTAIINCCNYFFFIRPNTSARLQEFWSDGYPPLRGTAAAIDYIARNFLGTVVHFALPMQSTFKDSLKPFVGSLPSFAKMIAIVFAIVIVSVLIRAARRERPIRWAILFFLIPLLTLIAINWARLYPVSSRRLTLFLTPCVAIVVAAALQIIWQDIARCFSWRTPQLLSYPLAAVATAGLSLAVLRAGGDLDESGDRGTESAVRYLRSEVDNVADAVYIHATLDEPVRLYRTMMGWNNAPFRTGNTGWPCCKRFTEARPVDPAQEEAYVVGKLEEVIGERPDGRLWIVFWQATRRPWLAWVKIDEPDVIIDHLQVTGCRIESERHFEGIVVDSFRCENSAP